MLKGLKYIAEAGNTGYGRAARGYLHALAESGVELTWTPMVPGRGWGLYLEPFDGRTIEDESAPFCNRPVDYDTIMVHSIGPYWRLWREREPGKRIVGLTVWETDRLLPGSLEVLEHVDGLIVPCRWNEQVFRASGFTGPLHVAPYVHHESGNRAGALNLDGLSEGDFVFYSIGEWKDRKGMHLTVESFCRAFTRRDPVALVIKTGAANEREKRKSGSWWWHVGRRIATPGREVGRILRGHSDPPRVVVLTRDFSDLEMRSLHARGDAYVSLTHAEGWGLGAYEAAFAGKPVIMTGYGGQLDYLPSDLSSHVDYQLVTAQPMGEIDACYEGHMWAQPDLDHGARLMRETFDRRAEARDRGRRLQAFVRENFNAQRIARDMVEFAARL